jgi:hypothetical protein
MQTFWATFHSSNFFTLSVLNKQFQKWFDGDDLDLKFEFLCTFLAFFGSATILGTFCKSWVNICQFLGHTA